MDGLHIKFESGCGDTEILPILSYKFEGSRRVDSSDANDYQPESKDSIVVLLCKCGANDWTDNGRFINEYECNCCGEFLWAMEAIKS